MYKYEIRSLIKCPYTNSIVSYGLYDTEKQARKAFKDLSTRNFANSKEIRSLGLRLVELLPVTLDSISVSV
jgi:hypothetical protein